MVCLSTPYAKNLRRCVTSALTTRSGQTPHPAHTCAHLVAAAKNREELASSAGRALPIVRGAPSGETPSPLVSASSADTIASPTATCACVVTHPVDARLTNAPRALSACLAVSLAPPRARLDSPSFASAPA